MDGSLDIRAVLSKTILIKKATLATCFRPLLTPPTSTNEGLPPMCNRTPRVFSDFMSLRQTDPSKFYELTTQRRMYNSHKRLGNCAFFDQAHQQ